MRIYTKSGDKGETGLIGGLRVSKNHLRIKAIGEVDELNAVIGIMRSILRQAQDDNHHEKNVMVSLSNHQNDILKKIQDDLFTIGAELADPKNSIKTRPISATQTMAIEKQIDELESKLPRLKNFILPGGTPFAAHAHLARAICRRAERSVVELHEIESINPNIIVYLNRLSDLLFMLARNDNFEKKQKETQWNS